MTHNPRLFCTLSICGLVWLLACGAAAISADRSEPNAAPRNRPAGVEKALHDLQEKIAQDRSLNGVFLTDAYINERDELVFKGLRPRCDPQLFLQQTKSLETLIDDYRKKEWSAVSDKPRIDLDGLDRVTNLLDQLQEEAAKQPKFRDVLFTVQKYEGGYVHFAVVQGSNHPKEELDQLIGNALQKSPDWRVIEANLTTAIAGKPIPAWTVRVLETFSFREFVSEVQTEIARSAGLDGTRVDDVFFSGLGRLTLDGIRPPVPSAPGGNAGAEDQVARQLDAMLIGKIASRGEKWADFVPVDIRRLRIVESPLTYLRQVVTHSDELDGIRIDRAYYDSTGALCVLGIQSSDPKGMSSQATVLTRMVTQELSSNANWPDWKGDTLSTAGLAEVDFQQIRANLHRALNAPRQGDKEELDRVRVDRIRYDIDNKLRLEGVRWNEYGGADRGEAIRNVIREELMHWDGVLEGHSESPDIAGITSKGSILSAVREILAQRPEMDGIRIENAYYDQEGKLHFHGAEAKEGQGSQASRILQAEADSDAWRRTVERGWSIDQLRPFAWDAFVNSLRRAISQTPALDGTRIDRLYYEKDLKLTFVGQRWGDAVEPLDQVVIDVLRADFREAVRNIDGTAAEALLDRVDLTQVRVAESFLAHLRKLIPQDCRLDGIRLDGMYYDDARRLQCVGLFDNAGQGDLLQQLCAECSKDARWTQQASQGLGVDSMRSLPMAPLLEFVKNTLPVYEELDGASVVRAFHAADGRLAFEGRVLSQEQANVVGNRMADQLELRPPWTLRLASFSDRQPAAKPLERIDVSEMTVMPVNRDIFEAHRIVNRAKNLYEQGRYPEAIEQLDLAMVYDPHYGYTWYYRALCYIALGKRDLARRDLRRAVDMERRRMIPQNLHYQALQRVQGPQRTTFEWLRSEALLQRQNGTAIRNLCDGVESWPEVRLPRVLPAPMVLLPTAFTPREVPQRESHLCGRCP